MPETTSHQAGSFCWADLATNDTESAKSFYGALFGWESRDVPTDVGVPYTMFLKNGKEVCALYPLGPDQGGAPPHWRSYVAVDDVDAAAATVSARGGNVLMSPMDVMDAGRMSMIQDPTGAVLGLWQPILHQGAQLWNEPGAICWNELLTRDPDRAEHFFGDVFGWTTRTSQSLMDGTYRLLRNGGEQIGGLLRIEPEWGDMPPNWTVYFGVDDCDGAIAEAKSRGGNLLFPAMEIENVGRFAYLQDPQGAVFAVIRHAHWD
jgi:predicted enzyme related to lactoylglutathione lyase